MEATEIDSCMLCYTKTKKIEDFPRVTRGMGDEDSPVLVLTHQPKWGCCKPEYNTPLSRREVNLINNGMSSSGLLLEDLYTINIVKCHAPAIRLPMFRKCFETHTEKVLKDPKYRIIIGLGTTVAKYVFSRGKTPPSAEALFGNPVQQFDLKGKILYFVRHPSLLLEPSLMSDEDAFEKTYNMCMEDYRGLGKFLKNEGIR